jgi:hypothetical protein
VAVLVRNSQVTAFVNDRQVFSDSVSQSLADNVDFGTKDIGGDDTDDATCEFKDVEVRESAS